MTSRCFLVHNIDLGAGVVTLTGGTARHIESVLRVEAGERIELRDGTGNDWEGVVESVKRGEVSVRIVRRLDAGCESSLELTLAVAMARSDRMDLVVRQATELGVHRIVAFRARRSQYGLSSREAEKRRDRWLRIAGEALCQCGRSVLPEIRLLSGMEELLDLLDGRDGEKEQELRLLAWEDDGEGAVLPLWSSHSKCARVTAVVGPEGGWSPTEVEMFRTAGFHSVRFGPRVLRFETAVVAFLSTVQLLWGDFNRQAAKDEES